MNGRNPTLLQATANCFLAVASGGLLLLLVQHPAKQSPALVFFIFCFLFLSSAGVLLLYSRSDPLWALLIPKIVGKIIPPTPPLDTAMFVLTVASAGLLLLLGQHPEEQSPALLFLMFCFFLLSSTGVMLLCSRSDPLWMFLIPKVVGKIIPPTPPLDTAMFVLTVTSGGLLLLLGQHPEEQSPAILFLLFCFFLLSSAGVMLLCSRSDPLWVLLTPGEMGKILPPAPLLATAKFVLAVSSGGLLLLLGQHAEEESAALLFFIFCYFQISSAAVMLLCSPLATALIKRQ